MTVDGQWTHGWRAAWSVSLRLSVGLAGVAAPGLGRNFCTGEQGHTRMGMSCLVRTRRQQLKEPTTGTGGGEDPRQRPTTHLLSEVSLGWR